MHIQIIPTLALAIGALMLTIPATAQTPSRFSFLFAGRSQSDAVQSKDLPVRGNANRAGGLYGFRYRGF